MNIKEVITVANQMQADGIIEQYAIGGAVGSTFYIEPASTLDLDIFITIKRDESTPFISLKPIYEYLIARGGVPEKDYIVIADTPVQFLPAPDPLSEEALREAVEKDVDGVPVRVFTAEHLAAIALKIGRAKDKMRLSLFLEYGAINLQRFEEILARHNLTSHWELFQQQFPAE